MTARPGASSGAAAGRQAKPLGIRLEIIASLARLLEAWRRVRSNNGQPGGDRVTIAAFGQRPDCELRSLRQALLSGTYRPRQLARHALPKPSGGFRQLAIPSVVDRVAQTAALMTLTPVLDRRMSEASFGYRPWRGVAGALAAARAAAQDGRAWVVDADIASFFDSVCHRRLMQDLCFWIDDERILGVFALWLKSFSPSGRGIAQGSPVSPFLANIYLHPIDRLVRAAGFDMIRYADDFLIMAHDGAAAQRALALAGHLLSARGLALNLQKTRIARADAPVTFLGELLLAGQGGPACGSSR